jgi:hypothetical protein
MDVWYVLWMFVIFFGRLVYFVGNLYNYFPFRYAVGRKLLQPLFNAWSVTLGVVCIILIFIPEQGDQMRL